MYSLEFRYSRIIGTGGAAANHDPASAAPRISVGTNHGERRANFLRKDWTGWLTTAARTAAKQGPAAGASVEPGLLRRYRHANRLRRHVVLHGHADRPAGAGAPVLDHPEARGRQALSRDPGREGRHPRRRCAVHGGRDAEGRRGRRAAPAFSHQCRRLGGMRQRARTAFQGSERRRADALPARAARSVGEGDAADLLRSGRTRRRAQR